MQIGRIANATRTLGGPQGYMVLPIRDDVVHCAVGGQNTPRMTSAWFPTPKELELLNACAPGLCADRWNSPSADSCRSRARARLIEV